MSAGASPGAGAHRLPDLAPIRAAIVDLDGTLVDTLGDFAAALGAMLAELGLPAVERGFIERSIGRGSEHLIERTLQAAGAAPGRFEQAFEAYQRHYAHCNGRHSALFPGVAEGLKALRARGWPLACLTNKPTRFARELLGLKGIAEHFGIVHGGDAFERKKPDPLPLQRTCGQLGLPPADVLMIGDSRNDVLAARAAGCPVVLVGYGYNHGEPASAAGADRVLQSLAELFDMPQVEAMPRPDAARAG